MLHLEAIESISMAATLRAARMPRRPRHDVVGRGKLAKLKLFSLWLASASSVFFCSICHLHHLHLYFLPCSFFYLFSFFIMFLSFMCSCCFFCSFPLLGGCATKILAGAILGLYCCRVQRYHPKQDISKAFLAMFIFVGFPS